MSHEPVAIPESCHDWMKSENPEPRDFIVQALLPDRKASLRMTPKGRRFSGLTNSSLTDRETALTAFQEAIKGVSPDRMKLLKSAGAIVVSVVPHQLKAIASLPGIREIRENRRSTRR